MACVVMAVIITMSLVLGAELGSKANPTTTTYVPRPEWYFFFLFEVLRVIKPPSLVAAGDDRRADDRHDPAVPAAVLRPRPRAPTRAPAGRDADGHRRDRRDGLPDLRGRQRGLADGDRRWRRRRAIVQGRRHAARRIRSGQEGGRPVGCLACHKIGENGNAGPGPNLTKIGVAAAAPGDRAHARQPDGADAVVQEPAAEEVQRDRQLPLAARSSRRWPPVREPATRDRLEAGQVRAMFDRIAGGLRPDEHGDDRRAAPPLARARRRARAGRRRAAGCSTWRPAPATSRSSWPRRVAPGRRGARQRLLRGDARARPREGARRAGAAAALRVGRRDGAALRGRRASTPRRSASGRATSTTSAAAWREMARVVRPGGRVVVLEITTPTRPPLSHFYRLWFDRLVPALGRPRAASRRSPQLGARRARRRSPTPTPTCRTRSSAFPDPAALAAELERAGLARDRLPAHRRRHRRDPRRHRAGGGA